MDYGDFVIEKEISYSINFSQDLLYKILNSYIVPNYSLTQHYFDLYDENNFRTRIPLRNAADDNVISSVKKTNLKHKKFVYWPKNTNALVPLVWRESKEIKLPYKTVSPNLNKIIKVYVYQHAQIEIKFEHVYYSKNDVDLFDSMMANKITKLLTLLEKTDAVDTLQNSQVGSDEILARLRLEYEFDGDMPDDMQLNTMCDMIANIEKLADTQNISPFVPLTTLLDKMASRKFEREQQIVYGDDAFDDKSVKKWALKLDGMRGRGLFMRNFCIIQTDDMQFYKTKMANLFLLNNIVAFQCEIMDRQKIYITDLLQVFKYKYNNRTQYECGVNTSYTVDAITAIECINYMNKNVQSVVLTDTCPEIELRFQQFFDPPIQNANYTTVSIDGYVVLDANLKYAKYKWMPTVELEYDAANKLFKTLNGPLIDYEILTDLPTLSHENIYECVITDTIVNVIKHRPDRIVPN
ncbi:lef-4 protein [Thysanoplusia orichalcea nucleopolyhedrovirus]|uniref:Lef-4 protein n=1 Tax=Thysanoplusia orichalcea nucleopolyhedrovirus TaxID=101850 RepID=L0CLZ0_9ABAC|nr:lef-4 protein [Thysanoplusia orichalcea nucleopolyhedrovirus]AGA16241.1 lef-4 protein [Thysanoplusia orichalcea nucleopolyhedrovirus]